MSSNKLSRSSCMLILYVLSTFCWTPLVGDCCFPFSCLLNNWWWTIMYYILKIMCHFMELEEQHQIMALKKQVSHEAGYSTPLCIEGANKKSKGKRWPMGMSEITQVSWNGHRRVVEYNELDQPIGESVTKLKSFIGTTMQVHVPITYQVHVPTELKHKIYKLR